MTTFVSASPSLPAQRRSASYTDVTAFSPMAITTAGEKPISAMSNEEKVDKVRSVVTQAGRDVREKYPFLKHQNAIGLAITLAALGSMLNCATLYLNGTLSAYTVIPLMAIFASITHEIEHDLIHSMYFNRNRLVHNLMLLFVWVARPNTISPWTRRRLHLHHHAFSGTEHDLEEIGLSNGMPWGPRRLIVIGDQIASLYLRPITMIKLIRGFLKTQPKRESRPYIVVTQLLGFVPFSLIFHGLLYILIVVHSSLWIEKNAEFVVKVASTLSFGSVLNDSATVNELVRFLQANITRDGIFGAASGKFFATPMDIINTLGVLWILPNYIRSYSLQFVSSNMHYYGDIDYRDVIKQTQVLTPWWMIPFQIFCFNFGATHAIHHFVPKEPFYIRQLTASTAHKVMREAGVRFNDFGTFSRTNRWTIPAAVVTK